ncbi:MAG: hypothetical protein WCX93_12105 [Burkholderiaceae bacterium]
MRNRFRYRPGVHLLKPCLAVAALMFAAATAHAELDGHGPDAWQVTDIAPADVLNVRMGPGSNYPVIETFPHNERGLQQITCVPFYTAAHYTAMTQAQINALPPRWCLMRNASMSKAGWVAQRYITPDDTAKAPAAPEEQAAHPDTSNQMIAEAENLVRDLYDRHARSEQGQGQDPLQSRLAGDYFTSDIVAQLQAGGFGAHPLYGTQDFDGRVTRIAADSDQPMMRGMITINVDFTNFGQSQRAVHLLRVDTTAANRRLRIFRVEHDGWSYP